MDTDKYPKLKTNLNRIIPAIKARPNSGIDLHPLLLLDICELALAHIEEYEGELRGIKFRTEMLALGANLND